MMKELAWVHSLLAKQSEGGAIDRVAEVTLEMMRRVG